MTHRQTLHNRAILITNGASALSQALCEQLIKAYKCRVALVSDGRSTVTKQRQNESAQLFVCDVTNRQQVAELAVTLEKHFGPLDMVIHQDCAMRNGNFPEPEEHYVIHTSNDILAFINLLTIFVPPMLRDGRTGGRFITVKNSPGSAKAFTDSQPVYNDLVRSIVPSCKAPESIRLSTIFCNGIDHKLTPFGLMLGEHEIAQRILEGIESERSIAQVSVRRSWLEFCSISAIQLAAVALEKLQLGGSENSY
ncbi:uncharacterized protein LOC129765787 [Toxorhynchites rutilus septentrionalis]|uniref:uncharacterized protein LOC129765787 n=1 Tax=Toxorhynchites rutilus septentrionalis TaxID=329112 RepID=UPI00247A77D8|nr:uncharacterized protein LOC129765787 [Toxorhynchites rutilus septentrionalis]